MLIKPRRLEPGDTIGIIAPASAPPDPGAIDRSVAAVEKLGFKPRLAPKVRQRLGFLAGNDRDRAGDLMQMFTDRRVKAILCVRGGYGTPRLLPLLDYPLIRRNPKIFVGYSDITALHCAFLTKAKLISFHGPMLNGDFIKEDMPRFTLDCFLRTVGHPNASARDGLPFDPGDSNTKRGAVERVIVNRRPERFTLTPAAPGGICQGYRKRTVRVLRKGVVTGPLIGGNLSLLVTLLATPYQPRFRGCILFVEDVDEVPYRLDRMLTHLLNAGLLQEVAGVAIGVNAGCVDPKAGTAREYRQTAEDVLRERLLPLKVPIVIGLPFGHVPHNATLPMGARVTLDGDRGDLIVDEAVVC